MKKSQAAMEFLVTYGWAILGVLLVVGALIYFGIFDPSRYADPYCNFGDQLRCEDYIIYSDGFFSLQLRNNFGAPIDISNIEVITDYNTAPQIPSNFMLKYIVLQNISKTIGNLDNESIPPGHVFQLSGTITSAVANNIPTEKYQKIKVVINYTRSGSNNIHPLIGELYSSVRQSGTCGDGVRNCHWGSGINFIGCESGINCHGNVLGDNICNVACT